MSASITAIFEDSIVKVPAWVVDNNSFLRWAESDQAPEKGKIGYLMGSVWIDHTLEQAFHNEIKAAITEALRSWNRIHGLGKYYTDGMIYSNLEAEFTTVPDGIFVKVESLEDELVVLDKGKRSTKMTGSPDIVVEVISRSSAKKDLIELRSLYHQAGIREYWLVDSRQDEPELVILEWTKRGYRSVPSQSGCVKSKVIGGSFRLVVDDEDDVLVEAR
ncbi:MAG TPA: Uma2 family endonuclease [Gemmatales bacterium]|nr:Uma2 family endonuclease [Gemmatales bacterium]